MPSPYDGLPVSQWREKTLALIEQHPLDPNELYDVVMQSWTSIFQSSLGEREFHIGVDVFPSPQIMGFFLHEFVPLEFERRYPGIWRKERDSSDKDIVYVSDIAYSVEIKTSTHPSKIFGNRSYAQEATKRASKKSKSGYYLAINFDKFGKTTSLPQILRVRFGWLDHSDWQGQEAATGQQANLSEDVERNKLLELPLK